jgi:NAD(P)H-dependent flavin oxidoreductase YrpB (nitropropane dioxygenase family)
LQGGEGGGHTGEVPTSILIPAVADIVKGRRSPLHGGPIHVVGAGGISDGRGLAMALSLGASAVWVGTRFVASEEGDAPARHKEAVLSAGVHDTVRTLIFSGRPMRVKKNEYIMEELLANGKLPYTVDEGKPNAAQMLEAAKPWLMGQVAGVVSDIKPAAAIINEMMEGCIDTLRSNVALISPVSKL